MAILAFPQAPGSQRVSRRKKAVNLPVSAIFWLPLGRMSATSARVLPVHSSSAHFLSFSGRIPGPLPLFCLHLCLQQVSIGSCWGRAPSELGTPAGKQARVSLPPELCAEEAEPWSQGRAESGERVSHWGEPRSQAEWVSQVGTTAHTSLGTRPEAQPPLPGCQLPFRSPEKAGIVGSGAEWVVMESKRPVLGTIWHCFFLSEAQEVEGDAVC